MSEFEDYEDEDTMAERKAEQAGDRAPEMRIEGLTAEAVESVIDAVIERQYQLRDRAKEAVDKAIRQAVEKALSERLTALADEQLRPLVAETVAKGWGETNNYGEPKGTPPKSLAEMLRQRLFGKEDRYSNSTLAEQIFRAELDKALKEDIGAALQEAKTKLRAMLDDALTGQFRKTLKDAIGLKD
jgi:hypothetical protein